MIQERESIEPIDHFHDKVEKLIGNDTSIGIVLFLSALAALIVANSTWGGEWYHHIWETNIALSFGDKSFDMSLHHLINDGLMAIFFFMVGLEIKREFLIGSLNSWKKASLPIGAAVGGMMAPALIYLLFTSGEAQSGWGIPMATDIAFTLGLINLVRNRIVRSLKVFVTSLAVVDDIGAVLVIALFYTSELHLEQLYYAGGVLAFLLIANQLGVRSVLFYTFFGIMGIWSAFFYAGIHPTIAGILLAFTIPARTKITRRSFIHYGRKLFNAYDRTKSLDDRHNSSREDQLLEEMENLGDEARAPLQKIESGLHHFVYFIIMPLFAFANAGVSLSGDFFNIIGSGIGLGIIAGLILGKMIGISVFSRLMVALKIAEMPKGADWRQVIGVAFLAGIGFTMSLFISDLAFENPEQIGQAKMAVLVASSLAALIGLTILGTGKKQMPRP